MPYRMNTSWDEERRNYRGGQEPSPSGSSTRRITTWFPRPGPTRKTWTRSGSAEAIFFISDRDSVANIWSYETETKKLAQVTKFTDFDVKTLSTPGRRDCVRTK